VNVLANQEGDGDYAVKWQWNLAAAGSGFTTVLRVKNEARSLPWVLPGLLRSTDAVVLVDNGSTDGTVELAARLADDAGAAARLRVEHYPFVVSRCGDEHLATHPRSVHSLTWFYNWSFSHVTTRYALKWDGDMVLTDAGERALRDLAWVLESSEFIVYFPRAPLYVLNEREAVLDIDLMRAECFGWPNRPGYDHGKGFEWEVTQWPPHARVFRVTNACACYELKWIDEDEFAHWSHQDFDRTSRTTRKRRELGVYRALREGGEPPPGVVILRSDGSEHVVDLARTRSPDAWAGR
jgi:glycosyltransferase involved in cell wall biosynthesis